MEREEERDWIGGQGKKQRHDVETREMLKEVQDEKEERRGDERRNTEIDGIESEREAGETSRKGGNGRRDRNEETWVMRYVCVCNAVHRTSRSRMESEERGGGEG